MNANCSLLTRNKEQAVAVHCSQPAHCDQQTLRSGHTVSTQPSERQQEIESPSPQSNQAAASQLRKRIPEAVQSNHQGCCPSQAWLPWGDVQLLSAPGCACSASQTPSMMKKMPNESCVSWPCVAFHGRTHGAHASWTCNHFGRQMATGIYLAGVAK